MHNRFLLDKKEYIYSIHYHCTKTVLPFQSVVKQTGRQYNIISDFVVLTPITANYDNGS